MQDLEESLENHSEEWNGSAGETSIDEDQEEIAVQKEARRSNTRTKRKSIWLSDYVKGRNEERGGRFRLVI